MKKFIYSTCMLSIIVVNHVSARERSDGLQRLIEPRETALMELRKEMLRYFSRGSWCDIGSTCNDGDCVTHSCNGGGFGPGYKCDFFDPVPSICGAERKEICKESKAPNGILLNKVSPTAKTDFGTVSVSEEESSMVVKDLRLRRDLCSFRKMGKKIASIYEEQQLSYWFYAGSSNGAFLGMPGAADPKCSSGVQNCGFNPTRRPWYIRASSGPKDVVFLFDATANDNDNVLRNALFNEKNGDAPLLDSLSNEDYVAVVAFDGNEARVIGSDKLERKTDNLVQLIREELPWDLPGKANTDIAIEKGFELLKGGRDSGNSSQCSRVIVLLLGSKDTCFNNCSATSTCNCVQYLVEKVRGLQESFDERKVSIIVFTEGELKDSERLARTIVCGRENNGLWRRIVSKDTADVLLSSYSQLVATSLFEEAPELIISEPYEDFSGLGLIFTVSLPVYDNRRLVGVVAADIPMTDVEDELGVTEAEAYDEVKKLSGVGQCYDSQGQESSCLLQELRSQEKNSAVCADIYPPDYTCYRFGSIILMPQEMEVSWTDAQVVCEEIGPGTQLAKISGSGLNRFVAGFTNADGSWVGAASTENGKITWADGTELTEDQANIGFEMSLEYLKKQVEEIRDKFNVNACVSVDRRGISGNWNLEPCTAKRSFVCQVPVEQLSEATEDPVMDGLVSTVCGSSIFEEESDSFTPINPTDGSCEDNGTPAGCTFEQEESMENANPLCLYQNSSFTDFDRTCCGGKADSEYIPPGTKFPLWAKILLGIGGGGLALLAVFLLVKYVK